MKLFLQKASSLIAILAAAAALAGCAANQSQPQSQPKTPTQTEEEHKAHHPDGAAAQPSSRMAQGGASNSMGMMGQGAQGGGMGKMGQGGAAGQMDMKSMCDMHDRMKTAGTDKERSAMMDENMKSMSPEMRQKHMEMMQQQCK
jgi:hypothetical protein